MTNRRLFLRAALATGTGWLLTRPVSALRPDSAGKLVIYKTPTCGCCGKWVTHVQQAGFVTEVHDLDNVGPIKAKYGVPAELSSCHTCLIDNYVIEGHVPADVITKLLKEKPAVVGIAAPGMPVGSPGMEVGGRKDPYEIVTFDRKGKTTVFVKR